MLSKSVFSCLLPGFSGRILKRQLEREAKKDSDPFYTVAIVAIQRSMDTSNPMAGASNKLSLEERMEVVTNFFSTHHSKISKIVMSALTEACEKEVFPSLELLMELAAIKKECVRVLAQAWKGPLSTGIENKEEALHTLIEQLEKLPLCFYQESQFFSGPIGLLSGILQLNKKDLRQYVNVIQTVIRSEGSFEEMRIKLETLLWNDLSNSLKNVFKEWMRAHGCQLKGERELGLFEDGWAAHEKTLVLDWWHLKTNDPFSAKSRLFPKFEKNACFGYLEYLTRYRNLISFINQGTDFKEIFERLFFSFHALAGSLDVVDF